MARAWRWAFSILERIELGETRRPHTAPAPHRALSVSSNGSNWVKQWRFDPWVGRGNLSVSSNGSNWVKRLERRGAGKNGVSTFSILERIELGETISLPSDVAVGGERFQYPRTDRIG